jgi:glycosyltransferase involved in cell wall biosynthesis
MTKISIVIGTFNQKDLLTKCLKSLLSQSLDKSQYEIILVDSNSQDGTEEMVVKDFAKNNNLHYFRKQNQGKSSARNFAIKKANGEIILLTDADMIAGHDLVEEHLKVHQKGNKEVAVEGLTYNLKKVFEKDQKNREGSNLISYIGKKLKNGQRLEFSYFLSGNLSCPKKVLIKSGMFDENFKGYGWEDIELGYRISKLGIPIVYNGNAINYHYHVWGNKDEISRKYKMGKSAVHFFKKHPSTEIKLFLGINPIANVIYSIIKKSPRILNYIKARSSKSAFFQYLLEEFSYRKGFEEEITQYQG